MPALIFTQTASEAGFALYTAQPDHADDPASAHAAFLLLPADSSSPPRALSVAQAWQQAGLFLFSLQPLPPAPQRIAQALKLTPPYGTTRGIAWITSASPESWASVSVPLLYVSPGSGQVAGANGTLPFGNVELVFPSGTQWTLQADAAQAFLQGNGIALLRGDGQGTPVQPDDYKVALSFAPPAPGALTFTAQWDPYNLFGLFADDPQSAGHQGGELRYFYPDAHAASGFGQLRYPVLPALPDSGWPLLAFDCEMDPLAPLDGARTRFTFQPQALDELASPVGLTVAGAPVTLAPSAPQNGARAGLYPAARPGPANTTAAYLAPVGPFTLTVPGGEAKMLCGTIGTEYLRVATGDILEFLPSMPACSASFGAGTAVRAARPAGAAARVLLDGPFGTSWVRFRSGGAAATRGYYAQPGASVNFSRGALDAQMRYPAAVSARVSTLELHDADGGPTAFPLVPYGGVFALADGTVQDGAILADYEKQVIACARGGLIRGDAPAPPVFVGAQDAPLPGVRTSTPQGLLVQLNDAPSRMSPNHAAEAAAPAPAAGTWRSLVLARNAEQFLSFDAAPATGVVDARLASTLMREQLFLVLNDWARFPDITRTMSVAGFNFEFAPLPGAGDARRTVLVFKYATTLSLADLIHTPESWPDVDYFIGAPPEVAAAQATLIDALKIADDARKDRDDPFADFRVLMADPAWTGMLAFNAPINGNGMPNDLQILFAGIDGQLVAHHFGVQANRISHDAGDQPQISESSMVGVIYYHAPANDERPRGHALPHAGDPAPDYGFAVEELAVTISKSVVTQFRCRVAMTIRKLFGREVTLVGANAADDVPPDTVVVAGHYQRRGEVGTVTFDGSQHGTFLFNPDGSRIRVIESFGVTGASLVPLAAKDAPAEAAPESTICSRFALSGALAFAANPFPGVRGLDLFSYGVERDGPGGATAGIELGGLSFRITCHLDAFGKRIAPPVIEPDFSGLLAADNRAAQRESALVRMLPLKLQAILHDERGIDVKSLGALPVQVPALAGVAVTVPGGGGVEPMPSQTAYVTSRPQYALQFALPLGSLGALADAHASLDASLIVAWGASTFTPDDDGVALFVQMPQVTAGAFGFSLQGLLKTTFTQANLGLVNAKAGPAYVLLFNNVALSVFGITLPPKVLTDFILFADASNPAGGNLGWSLAATQTS
ncbi:hypothetical protein ACEPT7_31900 [Burkholderia ubonensis]|uniref:hypothetical protein n=1 Tax=Burkholderia ubonensis TaxID=101571 RepID=UPI00358E3B5E